MAKLFNRGLLLLTDDLRINDNKVLEQAVKSCDSLLVIYLLDEGQFKVDGFDMKPMGDKRKQFLLETLQYLEEQLAYLQLELHVLLGKPFPLLSGLLIEHEIEALFVGRSVDFRSESPVSQVMKTGASFQHNNEFPSEASQQSIFRNLKIFECMNNGLFEQGQIPFSIKGIPRTFESFQYAMASVSVKPPLHNCFKNAPLNVNLLSHFKQYRVNPGSRDSNSASSSAFSGGARVGQGHLDAFLGQCHPSAQATGFQKISEANKSWCLTENSALNIGKSIDQPFLCISPWLANGSISLKTLWYAILEFEDLAGPHFVSQQLLISIMRYEHFQWLAFSLKEKLYAFVGESHNKPLQTFYPQRFAAWTHGRTPVPIINACMNQLNETGYITGKARELSAQYLIQVCGIDWRYGAAYFQMQLIDYQPAVNWGNWHMLAGLLTGPPGQVDFQSAARKFDPRGEYIRQWRGDESCSSLDYVDIVDWPVV